MRPWAIRKDWISAASVAGHRPSEVPTTESTTDRRVAEPDSASPSVTAMIVSSA
jgi:hypothetical protein